MPVLAVESDLPGIGLDQPKDESTDRRFAGSRFSDQRERCPAVDVEANTANSRQTR
jgi:hypothetical protein